MAGGQTVTPEEMYTARAELLEALESTRQQAGKVSTTSVTQQDMGREYTEYFQKYQACVKEATQAMQGLAGVLSTYAEAIGSGGRSYAERDSASASNIAAEGRTL